MEKEQSEELLATYVERGLRVRLALSIAVDALEDIEKYGDNVYQRANAGPKASRALEEINLMLDGEEV